MSDKILNSIAKEDDGTIQISFTIPAVLIKESEENAYKEYAKDVEVKGFRKGKAPLKEAKKHIPFEKIARKVIGDSLPKALGDAIEEHKISPMMYPKIELISAEENKDWQVRALTCEIPAFETGNYKDAIKNLALSLKKEKKVITSDEKKNKVLELLEKSITLKVPHVLIENEVEGRLTSLLERIEKLGLNLESYLTSIGKTPETLKNEYEDQARKSIAMELILEKIAQEEKIIIEEKEVDDVIKTSGDKQTTEKMEAPDKRAIIRAILRKRSCLDTLAGLL